MPLTPSVKIAGFFKNQALCFARGSEEQYAHPLAAQLGARPTDSLGSYDGVCSSCDDQSVRGERRAQNVNERAVGDRVRTFCGKDDAGLREPTDFLHEMEERRLQVGLCPVDAARFLRSLKAGGVGPQHDGGMSDHDDRRSDRRPSVPPWVEAHDVTMCQNAHPTRVWKI